MYICLTVHSLISEYLRVVKGESSSGNYMYVLEERNSLNRQNWLFIEPNSPFLVKFGFDRDGGASSSRLLLRCLLYRFHDAKHSNLITRWKWNSAWKVFCSTHQSNKCGTTYYSHPQQIPPRPSLANKNPLLKPKFVELFSDQIQFFR